MNFTFWWHNRSIFPSFSIGVIVHTSIKQKVRKKEYEVTFSAENFPDGPDRIKLVGSFNGWDTRADEASYTLLKGRNKKYKSIKLSLPAGSYEYKYFDPASECFIEYGSAPGLYGDDAVGNEFGTTNALLDLPEF